MHVAVIPQDCPAHVTAMFLNPFTKHDEYIGNWKGRLEKMWTNLFYENLMWMIYISNTIGYWYVHCQWPNETCHCKKMLSVFQQLNNWVLLTLYFLMLYIRDTDSFVLIACHFAILCIFLVSSSHIHIHEGTAISRPGIQSRWKFIAKEEL